MKRDKEGKFAQKNDEYRSVRSLRLTDSTWEALGSVAQSQGITRADLLELLVRSKCLPLPSNTRVEGEIEPRLVESALLRIEELESLCSNILKDLKLGKQAPRYQVVQKAFSRLLVLAKSRVNTHVIHG
ncbi:hypothetical protein ACE1CI_02150 [Aerosakkonemataceae cyanobacterium BLCC-F50]|uniref:Ribbon-helix-helix domain-containing protein n=1 Tax=Floridaenema flaviceps BLCC-F50 TaxID=3153642 RepID=A0ABV4XKF8_9CYAN